MSPDYPRALRKPQIASEHILDESDERVSRAQLQVGECEMSVLTERNAIGGR